MSAIGQIEPINVIYHRNHILEDHSNFNVFPLELKTKLVERIMQGSVTAFLSLAQTSKYLHALVVSCLDRCNRSTLNLLARATVENLIQLTDPAAIKAELHAFSILLRRGADPIHRPSQEYETIPIAARYGDLTVVQEIVRKSRDRLSMRVIALDHAAKHGQLELVRAMLEDGELPDENNNRGISIQRAARNGHTLVVRELLAGSRHPENHRGLAVEYASEGGHAALVNDVLESGPIPNQYNTRALIKALNSDRMDIARTVLQYAPWQRYIVYYYADFMKSMVNFDVSRFIMSPITQILIAAIAIQRQYSLTE